MEFVIPGVAIGLLYLVTNQSKKNDRENFLNRLPNIDIPNRNYPSELPIISSETDQTSELSTNNKFDGAAGVYTDKYFNPNIVSANITEQGGADASNPKYYSLTGQQVDNSYFQHNNMVPFFGSNVRTRHVDANSNESILDNTMGAGSQQFVKKEQSPLFAPSENQQWAFGAPNASDFMQSRVNPSMRMANVKPFAEESVAPGLGLGYTNQGAGGYNSGMMMRDQWTDKTVDQLRVDNNPKPTGNMLYGHEGAANSFIKQLGTMGIMEKNRPEQSFEMGQDRYFTTTGTQKGETLRPIHVERDVTRPETSIDYIGNARSQNPSEYVSGEYMPSHNIDLGAFPIAGANAQGRNYATDADYGIKSKAAYPNNRTVNHQDSYFGMVGGSLGAAVAPLLDALRPSRRQNVIGSLRPYQNPGTVVPQSYIFNPADRPNTTIRETTENSKMHMNVSTNQRGGAYEVSAHQPVNNERDSTTDFYYSGVAGAGERTRQTTSYESNYNQRNNDIKSSTIQGYMTKGNMSLMNGDINMRQVTRDDSLKNNRAISGTMPYQAPDVANMGRVAGNENSLYSNIHVDRNTSDIMSQLQGNPYVIKRTI